MFKESLFEVTHSSMCLIDIFIKVIRPIFLSLITLRWAHRTKSQGFKSEDLMGHIFFLINFRRKFEKCKEPSSTWLLFFLWVAIKDRNNNKILRPRKCHLFKFLFLTKLFVNLMLQAVFVLF